MHITAAGQSLILAGESVEVDNLAKRATLIKDPGGEVVVSSQPAPPSTDTLTANPSAEPGPVINYELWVNSGVADTAPRPARTPVDLYKRTFQGASQARPKIVDVFA